jgi:hypothetical protein
MHRKTPSSRQARAPLALALSVALGLTALPGLAGATTYTVTTANDSGSGSCAPDNSCTTLRAAVVAATSGSDTVTFASTLSGDTIVLSNGHIVISHSLTIQGPGANLLTVSGGAATSKGGIFYIGGGSYSLTISGITLANGNATYGGALAVSGFQDNVTLDHVALMNNHANMGGGGFYTGRNTVIVTHSTISGNSAGSFGGGFDSNYGTVSLIDSTVTGNSAGPPNGGSGGGIYSRGALTVNNSTISGNTSIIGSGFELNAYSGTVTNSIVSGNSNQQFQSTGQGRTPTLTISYSLINGSYFVGDGTTLSTSHLITGQDPKLGPLANNGGPTQTLALLPGSPAIDAGDNSTCETTDQRGVARPYDGDKNGSAICDMGAFEVGLDDLDTIFASGFD